MLITRHSQDLTDSISDINPHRGVFQLHRISRLSDLLVLIKLNYFPDNE